MIFLFLIINFAHASTPPPPPPHHGWQPQSYELEVEQYQKNCLTEDCVNTALFLKAQLWTLHAKVKACKQLAELAKKETDTLYPITLIKLPQLCKFKKSEKADLVSKIEKYNLATKPSPWLEKELRMTMVNLGKHDEVFNVLHLTKSKRDKEKLLKESLDTFAAKKPKLKAKLQQELITVSPRFGAYSMAAAQDALSSGEIDLGIRILNSLKLQNSDQKKKQLELLRNAYKLGQNKKEALKFSKQIYLLDKKNMTPTLLQSALNYTRAAWTEHKTQEALKTLAEAESLLKGKTPLSELYFIRSRILEEEGSINQTLSSLEQALTDVSKTSQLYINILWSQGWLNYKNSKFDDAKKSFELILKADQIEPGRKSQVQFWLAQTEKKQSNFNAAEKYFENIIREDPYGYYALLSYKELNTKIPAIKFEDHHKEKYPSQFNLALFEKLIQVGEYKYSQIMLDSDLKPQVDYFWLYKKAQHFSPLFNHWAKMTSSEKSSFLKSYSEFLFPLVYKDIINEAAQISGLWPEYIWAIMRQESSFNPYAQSSANALGLMQLLPSVAHSLSKKINIKIEDMNHVFDPSINIRLGALHLRDYWDMFNGNFVLSTASYNSSSNAVKSWLKTKQKDDILIFIEEIPYEETRNYVKLVLRNLVNYMRINTQEDSIEFPYWTLKNLSSAEH